MLNALKAIFQANFGNEVELGTIPYSCCGTDKTIVFDFDSIKDQFCGLLPIGNRLKSVDAMYFSPSGKLLFIEMKRYDPTLLLPLKDYINNHLQESELTHKIVDTLLLIFAISGYYNIHIDFYKYFLDNNPPKAKTVFLVNLTNKDYINYVYLHAAHRNISFTKRIDNRIAILNCQYFSSFVSTF